MRLDQTKQTMKIKSKILSNSAMKNMGSSWENLTIQLGLNGLKFNIEILKWVQYSKVLFAMTQFNF